jgi:PadR family transcriptional regulator PadR
MMNTFITARAALLQVLTLDEGYGLDLIERISKKSGGAIVLHRSAIYPALRRLEEDGFITSYQGELIEGHGGRPRLFYRVTKAGRQAAIVQRQAILGLLTR